MKFNKDWTNKNDVELKGYHECDWEESCTLCKNFNECEAERDEAKEKYENDLIDKLDSLN